MLGVQTTSGVKWRVAVGGAMLALSAVGCGIELEDRDALGDRARDGDQLELRPVTEGERPMMLRGDGIRTPLLTLDELRALPSSGAGSTPADVQALLDPPATYDLSAYQTPIRDQLDRGSCGTFATVAAIEAAYKRTWGLTLDLSEQYMFHVSKSTTLSYPRIYQYENQSSYWYGGGWPTTQYLLPVESLAPYAGYSGCPAGASCTPLNSIPGASALVWAADPAANHVTQQQVDAFEYSPLHIPMAARLDAKYGVATWTDYGGADARNTSLLESLISSNREVVLAFSLNWRRLPSGIWDYDSTVNDGGHAMLLIGYNRTDGYFLAKNSWGGAAYYKLSYRLLQNSSYAAAVVNTVVSPYGAPQAKARWMGKWYQDHEGWRGTLVVRRLTPASNAPVRLGTHYLYGSYANGHSVNGYSIDSNRGHRFYIASGTENPPGELTGQPFEIDQYDNDSNHAAGTVWWDTSGKGGVHLGRSDLVMPYSNTFSTGEWVGTWDLNSNGTLGVLNISSVTATSGDYVLAASLTLGGTVRTVSGTLERARPTIAHLLVDGVNSYTLHYHFWEDRLASGEVTRSGVPRNGVHAVRR